MKVDVFSITQNGKRTISFMSQALGLMADLDIGTENLRWMGDARFVVGLLRGGAVYSSDRKHDTIPVLHYCFPTSSYSIQTVPRPTVFQSRRGR